MTSWLLKEVPMKCRLMVVVSLIVFSTDLFSQAPTLRPNPLIGTWKQNMEKSMYNPGPAPLKGSYSIRQYAAGADGSIVAITMNIDPEGLPSLGAISAANYDGKEYPQHTVATLATSLASHLAPRVERTISYTPVDPYTVKIVQREDDKVVSASTRTISRDGRTMTDRFDYTDAAGQHVTNVLVFEKQ
jgi:hypothetical protein